MKGRRRIWLMVGVAAVLVAAGLAAAVWPRAERGEPIYEGRTLSQWVDSCPFALVDRGDLEAWATCGEHRRAVAAIGTNALPFLMRWVRYQRPGWSTRIELACQRVPGGGAVARWIWRDVREERASRSWIWLEALGPGVERVVPELSQCALGTNSLAAGCALDVLARAGPVGFDALAVAATNRQVPWQSRMEALELMVHNSMGLQAHRSLVVDTVLRSINDGNRSVETAGIVFAGELPLPEDVIVRALTNCLSRQDVMERVFTVQVLGRLGRGGVDAEPALKRALDDPEEIVRENATNAIQDMVRNIVTDDQKTKAGAVH